MQRFICLFCIAGFVGAVKEYNLLNDVATHTEMIPTRANSENATAYLFTDSRRRYKVSEKIKNELIGDMISGREFIFVVTLRQDRSRWGTVFAILQHSGKRLFDIQSVWKKREVRFNYLLNLHASQMHTEKFPYELADGQWHQLAFSSSGLRLTMFVDCEKVYVRTLPYVLPFSDLVKSGSMWLGQRGETRISNYFIGAIESLKFILGDEDTYLRSCKERLTNSCPSCHQHLHLVSMVFKLQEKLEDLTLKLTSATKSIDELKKCECLKRCRVGNKTYNDRERWTIGKCTECICKNGKSVCGEKACPLLNCKFPIKVESECCPRCSVSCEFRGVVFEHGEKKVHKSRDQKVCVICTCQHGGMRCRQYRNVSSICPKLSCPIAEQFSTPDDCCSFCPNTDFCAMNPNCHKDADCINLSTKHICKCKVGYRGNGYHCQDIDECADAQKQNNDLCGWNSRCINTNGSFECQCKPGFIKDRYNFCVDFDECRGGVHNCHRRAKCLNRDGSHTCQCQAGYFGDGYNCTALCSGQCQNGGNCQEPNVCECKTGFRGDRCQFDIDECALEIDKCHPNSKCVNVPGSYHCHCKPGFTDHGKANQYGQLCSDLNECHTNFGNIHTCNDEMNCRNLFGTYECVCKNASRCSKGCIYEISRRTRRPVNNGVRFFDPFRKCHACQCLSGKITCRPWKCDCRTRISRKCCPSCQRRRCRHSGVSHASGTSWIANCAQCTCEDGVRRCSPLLCPSMATCAKAIKLKGHCCKLCAEDNVCTLPLSINPLSLGGPGVCIHKGRRFEHKTKWMLSDNLCITCQCKFGHICCSQEKDCRSAIPKVT